MFSKIWLGLKVLLSYLMPFFPCAPKIGELRDADCIFVQAFGRNSMPDDKLGQKIWEVLRKANSLSEVFTFLSYSGFEPGKANEALAKKIVRLAKKYSIPIIAQWEVVYCIWLTQRLWFADNEKDIDCLWPPEMGYYATFDVKLASRQKMRERNKKRPIEVCHPAMTARAIPILWKIGVNVVVEPIQPWSFFKEELWVWDDKSIQPWTRGFIRLKWINDWWLIREMFGRFIHHPIKGWVSFIPPIPQSL